MKGPLINHNLWQDLAGKVIRNNTILLQGIGDIHPSFSVVCECETLIVDRCDKNFVYYWLGNEFRNTETTFPNVKTIYLGSHPCEPSTLRRLHMLPNTTTHLREDWYLRYKERWLTDWIGDVGNGIPRQQGKGVVMISRPDYEIMLLSLQLTEPEITSKQ